MSQADGFQCLPNVGLAGVNDAGGNQCAAGVEQAAEFLRHADNHVRENVGDDDIISAVGQGLFYREGDAVDRRVFPARF